MSEEQYIGRVPGGRKLEHSAADICGARAGTSPWRSSWCGTSHRPRPRATWTRPGTTSRSALKSLYDRQAGW